MEAKNSTAKKITKVNRTKAQLQKDLLKTQERLEKKEIELARCLQELQGTQQQISDIKKLERQLAAREKALSAANSKIKSLEKDIEQDKAAEQNQQHIAGQDRSKNLAQLYAEIDAVEKHGTDLECKLEALAKQVGKLLSEKKAPNPNKPVKFQKSLQKIAFQQSGRCIEPGAALRASMPFTVEMQLVLTEPPAREYLELDSPYYTLRVTAKPAGSQEAAIIESAAGQLESDRKVYKNILQMPKLSPGKYMVGVVALAPAIKLGEQKSVEIVVEK